jgi:acyl dehydratase
VAVTPRAGQTLPEVEIDCGRMALVRWAAGSGDFYPLHHDAGAAATLADGALVVPGRFKHAALGRLVSAWAGRRGRVRRLRCRYVAVDAVGAPLRGGGRVARVDARQEPPRVELRLWIEDATGRRSTVGEAELDWLVPLGGGGA